MSAKIVKASALALIAVSVLAAGNFNAQAEKDRKALVEYMEKKFSDPAKNKAQYFPYSTDKELKENIKGGLKFEDFAMGSYAFNKQGKAQYDEIAEMPPYEDAIDAGEELYNGTKGIKECFPDPAIAGDYPKFDEKKGEVVTLTSAINDCLKASGQKPWNAKKGKMAELEAYFAYQSKEAGKKVKIQIPSKAAQEAYERGKKNYYSQRGYLKLSCPNCHVQGA
jgi:sulfur-oxidizing protein SoxA